jgi:hypothetical protein
MTLVSRVIRGVLPSLLALMLCPPPAAAQQPVLAAGNTASRFDLRTWEWTIFVMGDSVALSEVKCVSYLLHVTFAKRVQEQCDRGSVPGKGFPFTARGWGAFTVGVTVRFNDGRKQLLSHYLDFESRAQGWGLLESANRDQPAVIPVTSAKARNGHFLFTLRFGAGEEGLRGIPSVEIDVREDGSARKTPWSFDLLMNEEEWIHINQRAYSDRAKRVRLAQAELIVIDSSMSPLGPGPHAIRIVGYR